MISLFDAGHVSGTVKLLGSLRDIHEDVCKAYVVQLRGETPAYGEWRPSFHENQVDFDIEIVSVGYHSELTIGSRSPNLRKSYEPEKVRQLEELLECAFRNEKVVKSGSSVFKFES